MFETLALVLLIARHAPQQQPVPLMTPLEHVSDPLKRALSSLTHAANQTCEVKAAIVDLKSALKDLAAGETFLAQHGREAALSAVPPDVAPDFTPPPRPAPRRNEMLEGALKSVETAFHRLTDTPGADLGGERDKAYRHMDGAAKNLMAAIKSANAAFRQGRGELPSCKPDAGRAR
jgi:hypothetical protein